MTPIEYAANVAARFGKGNLPSWSDLSRRDNRAMLARAGNPMLQQKLSEEKREHLAELRRGEGTTTTSIMLAAMTEPMTRADLSRKTGLPESTLTHALLRARDQRLVDKTTVKRMAIWHRIEVAAE